MAPPHVIRMLLRTIDPFCGEGLRMRELCLYVEHIALSHYIPFQNIHIPDTGLEVAKRFYTELTDIQVILHSIL